MDFDTFIAIDWSGRPGKNYDGIAVAVCEADRSAPRITWLKLERKRLTELECKRKTGTEPASLYQLFTSKQVGKASITGMRVLRELRAGLRYFAGNPELWKLPELQAAKIRREGWIFGI